MQTAEFQNSSPVEIGKEMPGPAEHVLRQVHDELKQLLHQRSEIMRRIGTAKKTIAGLASLFGESALGVDLQDLVDGRSRTRKPGLTKACRTILMEAERPLSARAVQDRLQERYPTLLEKHKDPLASVTTILNRLGNYGEAQQTIAAGNTRTWQWVAEPTGQVLGRNNL